MTPEQRKSLEGIVLARRCGDHGCIWGHGGGLGTNGGCRHDKMDRHELRREVRQLAATLREVLEQDEPAGEPVVKCRGCDRQIRDAPGASKYCWSCHAVLNHTAPTDPCAEGHEWGLWFPGTVAYTYTCTRPGCGATKVGG
jgi:hypothetical protein